MNKNSHDDRYWNLAQAAAWVVYRENELVEQMAKASKHSFGAIASYPTMWPADRKKIGNLAELERMLINKKLVAKGYSEENPDTLSDIPASNWPDLHLRPPYAYDARDLAVKREPWTNIRIESADAKRLWRSGDESRYRTIYDADEVKKIYEECSAANSSLSKNKRIGLTQDEYAKRHGANIRPSTTTVKRLISE